MQMFTIKQAASILAVSPQFLKRLQREERLRVVRLGRAVRIPEQELERLSMLGFRRRAEFGVDRRLAAK